jgi:DNA replicative helicase MCM subunit Mcm2 (Cdc46/Mcm family)
MRWHAGDPGCFVRAGKSQLMKYASQLSVRTVVASGTGSSAAGLTATAVREGSSWALQVG